MEFILVGQPNSGKSTIFNSVIGYKSEVANFPGVTVSYTRGNLCVNSEEIEVVDIPGTYSLQTSDEAEQVAVDYILNAPPDAVIINILDASVLSRSLELTLQLMELKKPMVIVLNMIDEAERKGIHIDTDGLIRQTGLPVIKTIATKGEGISELFKVAQKSAVDHIFPQAIEAPHDVERVIQRLIRLLQGKKLPGKWNPRLLAIKLIEKDPIIGDYLDAHLTREDWKCIENQLDSLEKLHKRDSGLVIASVRHNLAFKIFEEVARVGFPPRKDLRDKLDSLLMHPILGYLFMAAILYVTFTFVFSFGDMIEPFFSSQIESAVVVIRKWLGGDSILFYFATGIIQGFGGGIGIVIPYLLPFFIVFSILEDTGYLARIAYLIDNLMHRIGLHGMSVVPMVLGYGCTVPGIMATRVLKSKRDKLITATLTTMIPCSARMIIIIGVAGAISLNAAILVYIINILVIGLVGKLMSVAMPEVSPGLLLEIPKYHLPGFAMVMRKTWFRMKEFVIIAWPILIVGSTVLEIIHFFRLSGPINSFLEPFISGVLGLPAFVGIVFLFGVLRKELVLVMLITILGTENILQVMSPTQVYTFTIFSTFYIPCLATFAVLVKELKLKNALLITGLTMLIAVVLSVMIRFLFPLIV